MSRELSWSPQMPAVTNPVVNGDVAATPIKLKMPGPSASSSFASPTMTMLSPAPMLAAPRGSLSAAVNRTTPWTGYDGIPSHIKNAVKMIQPFYSENATVEKAKSFWNAFERATVGLDEQLRLSAFRECLKGKTGGN
ncbi:hypothetical protein PC128_g18440 [Phytophthora cactorum]|nr:hypothetical protein PC128_g18440 [Phytophthora cactorum]